MIKRSVIVATSLLAFLSLAVAQNVRAEDTKSTESKPATVRPLKKLHKKIRSMRPSVKARKALKEKAKGTTDKPAAAPTSK